MRSAVCCRKTSQARNFSGRLPTGSPKIVKEQCCTTTITPLTASLRHKKKAQGILGTAGRTKEET